MAPRAKRKALLATAGFTFFGILFLFTVKNFLYSLPALILYAGLLINTYFSIRCFSSITPENDIAAKIIDICLAALYIILAAAFNNIQNFLIIGLFLFELAAIKYTMLLRVSAPQYHGLIQKKILIDMFGVVSCSLALALTLRGYSFFSIWLLAALLLSADIYLIMLRPFYKIG